MNINYEYYRIFYYVAKYRNLTQAAEIMHNNQPNISRVMKLLEHELGCTLIIRSNRGITLTPEGERLYSHVKIAVEQIQAGEEEIIMSTGLEEGVVTIGASETALHLLLPVLKQFKQRYPKIHIRISNHLIIPAIQAVKNGVVDFAIVATPVTIEKPLRQFPIMDFHDVLIGGPSYAFLSEGTHALKDLSQYPLVCLGEGTMTNVYFQDFYRSHQLILKPELEAATTDQILPIVRNDFGIGFVPEVFAKEALNNHEVYQITLKEELPPRQICFIENADYPLSIAAKEIRKLLLPE
jgi:DNA-binding transcriptional LysR family regulator